MQFDVHITESLLRRVGLRRLFRRWPLSFLALVLVVAAIVLDVQTGQLGAFSIIGLTAIAIQLLIHAVYFVHLTRSIRAWQRMQGSDPVHYELTVETLKATSNLGSTELKWSVFRELLEHPDYLLLSLERSGHLTLPLSDVPAEALAFIRQRFATLRLPTRKV